MTGRLAGRADAPARRGGRRASPARTCVASWWHRAAALTAAAVLSLTLAATVQGAPPRPLGLPTGESLLFAMQAESGSLVKRSGRAYVLTLRNTPSRTVWFTDRPTRDTGRVATSSLVRAWKRLGFVADRPNAVLGAFGRETPVELGRPVLADGSRTLRMRVRLLGRRTAPPRSRFGAASLFIDNALLRRRGRCGATGAVEYYPSSVTPMGTGLLPADGRELATRDYPELFDAIGTRFGEGNGTFKLPVLEGPGAGLHAVVCTNGAAPEVAATVPCSAGAVQLFATTKDVQGRLPADGRKLSISENVNLFSVLGPRYGGNGSTEFALPAMPRPPAGTRWQVCVSSDLEAPPGVLSEVSFLGFPPDGRDGLRSLVPADGRSLSVADDGVLFSLLSRDFGPRDPTVFSLPDVLAPLPGVVPVVRVTGIYPTLR